MNFFKKKEEIIPCSECHCMIKKSDAQKVEYNVIFEHVGYKFYCGKCRKPYTTKNQSLFSGLSFYKTIEVTEDGEPIGYEKINDMKKKKGSKKC